MGTSGEERLKVGKLSKPYFRGQSINRLDAKGRLRIPTKFRDVLQTHYQDGLVITVLEQCLVAYPPDVWEKIESKVESFSQVDPQQRAFMRYYISSAEECEFDNQGRILIPPVLRERVSLGQEVLLAGMLTSFEIWNKEAWDNHTRWDSDQYQQIMSLVAGTGL